MTAVVRWCGRLELIDEIGFLGASQLDKQGSIFKSQVFGGVRMVCAIYFQLESTLSFSTGRLFVRMLQDTLQFLPKQFSIQ